MKLFIYSYPIYFIITLDKALTEISVGAFFVSPIYKRRKQYDNRKSIYGASIH